MLFIITFAIVLGVGVYAHQSIALADEGHSVKYARQGGLIYGVLVTVSVAWTFSLIYGVLSLLAWALAS